MIKYEATGLVQCTSGTSAIIHGFVFVAAAPSDPYFKYDISSFLLWWDNFIFAGNTGYLNFQYFEDHGMDGDVGQSLSLQKSDSREFISGSETVIMDSPLPQNPSEFVLPNTLRYMGSFHFLDVRFDSCELWLHRACPEE